MRTRVMPTFGWRRDADSRTARSRSVSPALIRPAHSRRSIGSALLTVLFVTSCVTYEPAASGLVSDGGASVASVGSAVPGMGTLADDRRTMRPLPDRSPLPGRPFVAVPSPRLVVVRPGIDRPSNGGGSIRGQASWYCGHGSACTVGFLRGGLYAAAGPALRVGDWRGRIVVVHALGRSVRVRLIDWCACPHRLLDLYRDAFSRLADPSRGLVKVTVSW